MLMKSVDRLNFNAQNSEFRKNASNVIAAMLEARVNKQQIKPFKPIEASKKIIDPEILPPQPIAKPINTCDQELPLPPPPMPLKIPASILTPPLSSDENDLPQKAIDKRNNNNNLTEKVNFRNKKNHSNGHNNQSSDLHNSSSRFSLNKPELSIHARDRRSYIEKNNNEVNEEDEVDVTKIADGLANGQNPVCDKCKCKITR